MGIFDNTSVPEGRSAATVQQGVVDQSMATKIEGLKALDTTFQQIGAGFVSSGDDSKDKMLAKLSSEVLNVGEAVHSGQMTKGEGQIRAAKISDAFIQANPHYQKDIDTTIKRKMETYDVVGAISKGTVQQQEAEAADREAMAFSYKSGFVKVGETDPTKLAAGKLYGQQALALTEQLKLQSSQISLDNAQLEKHSKEHSISMEGVEDQTKRVELSNATNTYSARQNIGQLTAMTVQGTHAKLTDMTAAYARDPGNIQLKNDLIQKAQEMKSQNIAAATQLQNASWLPESDRTAYLNASNAPLDTFIAQINGKQSAEVLQSEIDTRTKTSTLEIISGPDGRQVLGAHSAYSLFGTTPAGTVMSADAATKIFLGKNQPDGTIAPNVSFLEDNGAYLNDGRTSAYSSIGLAAQKANANNGPDKDKRNGEVGVLLGSVFAGASKPSDSRDPVAYKQLIDTLASKDVNDWATNNPKNPQFNSAAKATTAEAIKNEYGQPAFQAVAGNMQKILGDKPLNSQVDIFWRDDGIQMKPKDGLDPQSKVAVQQAIDANKSFFPGMSNIVKATATIENSNDFKTSLEHYSPFFFGTEATVDKTVPTNPETGQAAQTITPAELPQIYPQLDQELALRASVMKKHGADPTAIELDAQEHVQELVDRFNSGQPLTVSKGK